MVKVRSRRIRITKGFRPWTQAEDLVLYDVMEHVRRTGATKPQGYNKVSKMTGRSSGAAYQRWRILSHQITSGEFQPELVRATLIEAEQAPAVEVISPKASSEVFNPQDVNEAALEDLVKRLINGARKAEAQETVAPRLKHLVNELLDLVNQL